MIHNPWEEIDLITYESHMSLKSVAQLQLLNQMMKEQFESYGVSTIMVLGIAGGNGLEHINVDCVKKVYGVDVNPDYLLECGKRYKSLGDTLETICTDLLQEALQLPHADLLVADLLVEYIGYACFQKVVNLVGPQYVSCIIQVNTDESFVSDSPYLHSFDCLEKVHCQMEEAPLTNAMQKIGYKSLQRQERALPNGKRLVRMDFCCKD